MNWNAAGDDTALSYRTDGMTNFGLAEVVQADRGPLVLMRLRAYKMKQPVDPTTVPNGPAPGFLIWIQRAK